ncbi:YlmC/YmxH family sporulation protein [Caldalkalibacillus uzonensis]|nr:YlmC/YmxH family sporulation protein [Caldalkalibacillus uzonensis]
MIKISELQTKDVVNIVDGKNLGTIYDLEINLQQGHIDAIVCPGPGKFFGLFSNGQDIVIPWHNIVKIGSDVILVRLDTSSYRLEEEGEQKSSSTEPPVYRPYSQG